MKTTRISALSNIVLTLLLVHVLLVSGFTSGRRPSSNTNLDDPIQLHHQHHHSHAPNFNPNTIDSSSSVEEYDDNDQQMQRDFRRSHEDDDDDDSRMENMLANFEMGPGGGGGGGPFGAPNLPALINAHQHDLQAILVSFAEDMAEESTKKCHVEKKVPIDYDGLKNDLITCLQTSINILTHKLMEITETLDNTQIMVQLSQIKLAILGGQQINDEQKALLKTTLFAPFCSTLRPIFNECDNAKYSFLAQFQECKSDVEKDAEEFAKALVDDICRDDGDWIIEYLNASPMKCAKSITDAAESTNFQQCAKDLEEYAPSDRSNLLSKPIKKIEDQVEFCNVTHTIGICLSELLVTSCPDNPKPGQILLNTIKSSRDWWSAKCSATNLSLNCSWWSLLALVMMSFLLMSSPNGYLFQCFY